jgi:inosine-uridine nucleoside N-ribohydrolase
MRREYPVSPEPSYGDAPAADAAPQRVWVDTDIALGAARGDVDDGLALAFLLRQPGVQVCGVSIVAGNTDAPTAARCARDLLAVLGAESLPVLEGAHAIQALAGLPPQLRVIALGPLGNLAAALAQRGSQPAWPVDCVGGLARAWPRPWLGFSDLNRGRDLPAWNYVHGRTVVRHCPLDVVRRLRIDRHVLAQLAHSGPGGAYLARHAPRWLDSAPWRHGARSFPAWDLVCAMAAVGALPGVSWSADGRQLRGFDPGAALACFMARLAGPV